MKNYEYILFDLDGTLTESGGGVRASIEHAMSMLSLPCPDLSDFSLYVGPPLADTFRGLCAVPEELVDKAVRIYRDYYDVVGIRKTSLYDGVVPMLDKLRSRGGKIAVCTSKNEIVAKFVCDTFNLSPHIDAVCGSTLDGSRKAKVDLIPYALDTLGCDDKTKAVMIGDTHFDAEGAALTGVDFIGVTYGYGSRESMEEFGAVGFADSPSELTDLLR